MRSGWLGIVLVIALGTRAEAQEPRKTADWGMFDFDRETGSMHGLVAGAPDSVFLVLKAVFAEIGLPPKDEDTADRKFGGKHIKVVRKLAKRPASYFISCGDGLTGPNADSWYIYVSYGIQVMPAPGKKASLRMSVNADAIDVPNGLSDRMICTTTGQLELEILRRLRLVFPGTT